MSEQQQEQQPMGAYNVDIVMCIDGTASMSPIIDKVKKNALSFYKQFVESMKVARKSVGQLRIKVIVFRDYICDSEPMTETRFYTLPGEEEEFNSFVDSIEAKGGGDLPENALEAIALAVKSDWTTDGSKRRHAILVFSDAAALPLGERAGEASYPPGMPKTLAELGDWWHGYDQSFVGNYQPKAGRLVVFVPDAEPWSDMREWNRYIFKPSLAGEGLKDVEIQEAIDMMVGSF